jgi:hypothetical protein
MLTCWCACTAQVGWRAFGKAQSQRLHGNEEFQADRELIHVRRFAPLMDVSSRARRLGGHSGKCWMFVFLRFP